jgi:acyl-CoA reductase-like NAD-dependent aldehyde dehydrogenase
LSLFISGGTITSQRRWATRINPMDNQQLLSEANARVKQLTKALQAASDHLDYCGYGDKWEREVSEKLPKQIERALKAAAKNT